MDENQFELNQENDYVNHDENHDENQSQYQETPEWRADPDSGYTGYQEQTVYSQQAEQKPKKNKGRKIALGVTAAVACCALIVGIYAGVSTLVNNIAGSGSKDKKPSVKVETVEPVTLASSSTSVSGGVVLTDVSEVVENCMPSIVAITSQEIIENGSYPWFGGSSEYIAQGAGSGIIIAQTDKELLIATNNHVVEGATSLSVQFIDDKSYDAVVKGSSSENDVAVIAIPLEDISEDTLSAIKIAVIGDSDQLKVGQGVIAIGNALGYGQSVTVGVISALDREVTTDSYTKSMMQIDAAINGGNSGGALINAAGEVIGINSAKYSSSGSSTSASVEGMGFAIPMNDVKDLLEEFINQETRVKVAEDERGYLGIYGSSIESSTAEFWGSPQGVMVSETIEGYAAEKAGLQKGDIIVKLDGKTISSMDSLKEELEYYAAGETVTVTISYQENRKYVEKDVEVTLSEAPKQ